MADFYELLGVSRQSTADEIKRAYRQRARQLHPDANPDDPNAEAQFKEVARAYETLSDPQRRQQYDTYGEGGPQTGSPFGGGGLGDIFDMFFNGNSPFGGGSGPTGPPRGADVEAILDIEFAEAVFGCEASVTVRTAVVCEECEGSGADGVRVRTAVVLAKFAEYANPFWVRWSPLARVAGAMVSVQLSIVPVRRVRVRDAVSMIARTPSMFLRVLTPERLFDSRVAARLGLGTDPRAICTFIFVLLQIIDSIDATTI